MGIVAIVAMLDKGDGRNALVHVTQAWCLTREVAISNEWARDFRYSAALVTEQGSPLHPAEIFNPFGGLPQASTSTRKFAKMSSTKADTAGSGPEIVCETGLMNSCITNA